MSTLITPRQQRTRKIKVTGGSELTKNQTTFSIVVAANTPSDVKEMAANLILAGAENQIRLGNSPERLTVDGDDQKAMELVKKTIKVTFEDSVNVALIDAIERNLVQFIAAGPLVEKKYFGANANPAGYKGRVGNLSNWQWIYGPPSKTKKVGDRETYVGDPREAKSFPRGAVWILKPRENNTEAGVANAATFWMTDRAAGKKQGGDSGVRITSRSSTKRGFIAQTTASVKRLKIAKDYTIWGGYSAEYALGREQWFPDWMTDKQAKVGHRGKVTPFIIVMAKSKRTGGMKGYKSDLMILRSIAKAKFKKV